MVTQILTIFTINCRYVIDLEDISTLGTDDIAVQISELGVGLRITVHLNKGKLFYLHIFETDETHCKLSEGSQNRV